MNVRDRLRVAASVAIAAMLPSMAPDARASGLPWEIWKAPSALARVDPDDRVLETSSHCLDGCRYDRTNAGPESPADNPYPERWIRRDGDEAVVFDQRGPGAVTRFWVTTGFGASSCIDPAIRARFYLDDAATPTIDIPLAALFDGSTPPFTPPLVADRDASSGGFVSNVPIAYARAVRIALTGADDGGTNPCTGDTRRLLWFQIDHHQLAPDASVESFRAGDDFPALRAFLTHAGDDPWDANLPTDDANGTLVPGGSIELASRDGSGWLRGIRLDVARAAREDVRIEVVVDGAIALDAPLADAFASAPDATIPARGVLAGEDADGWLYAWTPMPFARSLRVRLVAGSNLAAAVDVASALAFDDAPIPVDAGRFQAKLVDTCSESGDLVRFALPGAGRIVGVLARFSSSGKSTIGALLEGDERIAIDGAVAPAWYGTGIEDFFGGGFYFDHGAYSLALAGATRIDAAHADAYRWFALDAPSFANGIDWHRESGASPGERAAGCARVLVESYLRSQAETVVYDRFEVATAGADAHAYTPPSAASCTTLAARFEDEPPTALVAPVCRFPSGASRFRFSTRHAQPPLRLRRRFDAGAGTPGAIAGSAGADVLVNGVAAGTFAPVIANPSRRWQQQDVPIAWNRSDPTIEIEIVPRFAANAPLFSESEWTLLGGWRDGVFAAGFDPVAASATLRQSGRQGAPMTNTTNITVSGAIDDATAP